VTLVNFVKNLW